MKTERLISLRLLHIKNKYNKYIFNRIFDENLRLCYNRIEAFCLLKLKTFTSTNKEDIIMRKVRVDAFLRNVLDGNGQELRNFRGLSSAERNALETEAHQRSFMNYFMRNTSEWEKKGKSSSAENALNFENEVLSSTIVLATKAKETFIESEEVTEHRMVSVDGRFKPEAYQKVREKKVKEPKAVAEVSFKFDSKKNVLEVDVTSISVKDPGTKAYYRKELEKALEKTGDDMECFYNITRFVKYFFDTLHVHKITYVTGSEALVMMRIYKNARIAYPLFSKLKYTKQIEILDKGFRKARRSSAGSRDIHTYAKATFEAMCEEGGVINEVYKHDFVTNKMMTYKKVGEQRRDRRNPDNSSQIWEKNCLIFVDYIYGKTNIRTSLLAFDLWDLLARDVRTGERSEATVW